MEWAVNTPGGQVRLGDLPLEAIVGLEKETDMAYWDLVSTPMRTATGGSAVYAAACRHAGVEPKALTARDFIEGELFVKVDDDQPLSHDPNTGLPNTEGAPEMSGSSGAPGDSDGPQT